MDNDQSYFNKIKQECIEECGKHSLEEIAKGMFDRKEIVSWSCQQEDKDKAFDFIIDLMRKYFTQKSNGRVYIPGSGAGGLSRRIMKSFPNISVLQVDKSQKMVAVNKKISYNYKNTEILEGDILNFQPETNSLNAIIAYGIMRYIPEFKRDNLVTSWISSLVEGGVTIIGEGIAENIIREINSEVYASEKIFEGKAHLFRCSLFYLLFRRYNKDNVFREKILEVTSNNKLNYAKVLENIAGFIPEKLYAKILQK